MITKLCQQCQGVIIKPPNESKANWEQRHKYCSKKCMWPPKVPKVCLQCSKPFEVRNYRKDIANYCSQDCSHKSRLRGNTTKDERARRSAAQKRWRKAVFERDGYACVECGDSNHKGRGITVVLQADHIKPFALYPELRLDLNNGRTLCVDCHKQTNTYGPKSWRKVCIAIA